MPGQESMRRIHRFAVLGIAAATIATPSCTHPSVEGSAGAVVGVIADHPLTLKEAPDSIVVADDGNVWVASTSLGAFVKMDSGSGNFEKFPYANGGAFVTDATSGDRGSLFYLDGLNNTVVWRIDGLGSVMSVSLGRADGGRPSGLASVAGSGATAIFLDALVKFDAAGPDEITPMPKGYSSGEPIVIAPDRTTWFSTYSGSTGVGWLRPSGLYDFASTPQVWGLVACAGSGVAYLSWEREPGAHADDYAIGWLSNSGTQKNIRRWRAPSPTPVPAPGRLGSIPVRSTCGLCGAPTKIPPRRSRGLLACTASTAWVQIDDRLDRLQPNGMVESFDLHSLIDERVKQPESSTATPSQIVWVYSVAMQRLIELDLR